MHSAQRGGDRQRDTTGLTPRARRREAVDTAETALQGTSRGACIALASAIVNPRAHR